MIPVLLRSCLIPSLKHILNVRTTVSLLISKARNENKQAMPKPEVYRVRDTGKLTKNLKGHVLCFKLSDQYDKHFLIRNYSDQKLPFVPGLLLEADEDDENPTVKEQLFTYGHYTTKQLKSLMDDYRRDGLSPAAVMPAIDSTYDEFEMVEAEEEEEDSNENEEEDDHGTVENP